MAKDLTGSRYESVKTNEHGDISPIAGSSSWSPYFRVNLICLLLGMTLGIAMATAFGLTASDTISSASCWVFAPLSPIPSVVMSPRRDKVFNPDPRYIGPSKEVDENWIALVGGY
jgi:hypothetical protein